MIQNVYRSSLSDPNGEIDFGINLTRINRLIEAHRVAYYVHKNGGRGPSFADFIPFHAPNMTNSLMMINSNSSEYQDSEYFDISQQASKEEEKQENSKKQDDSEEQYEEEQENEEENNSEQREETESTIKDYTVEDISSPEFTDNLQYVPLVLRKDDPYDKESDNYTLMNHVSNPSIKDKNEIDDRELSPNSLIQLGKVHTPKLLI